MRKKFRIVLIVEFDSGKFEFHTAGVESIEEIKKENVESLLEGVELRLERVKQLINMSEFEKEKFKDLMRDLIEKEIKDMEQDKLD